MIRSNRYATFLPGDSDRARFLALPAANWIAPVTHQDLACCDTLRPRWRLVPPQRNVGAKPCPKGGIRMAVAVATPVRCWLAAWAIQSYAFKQMAQRRC